MPEERSGIKEFSCYESVERDNYTGVAPGNKVAKSLYQSVGFGETGLIELGMEEMRLIGVGR